MFESMMKFFKKFSKKEENTVTNSKEAAKERLHLVLMQDRANVSADFLELMKQEIIEVIKKYIDVDEAAIDVRLTNKENEDGTNGAPALYANIPILNIKNDLKKVEKKEENKDSVKTKEQKKEEAEEKKEDKKTETTETKIDQAEADHSKKENVQEEQKTTKEKLTSEN